MSTTNGPSEQSKRRGPRPTLVADRDTCFLCSGRGHWARNCTSLPPIYLAENPPHCYSCGGIGHYARFCPSSIQIGMLTNLLMLLFPIDAPIQLRTIRPRAFSDLPSYYYPPTFPILAEPVLFPALNNKYENDMLNLIDERRGMVTDPNNNSPLYYYTPPPPAKPQESSEEECELVMPPHPTSLIQTTFNERPPASTQA